MRPFPGDAAFFFWPQRNVVESTRSKGGRVMLTNKQVEEFQNRGYVRVQRAFSPELALGMQGVIWSGLNEIHSIVRDDPSTWKVIRPTGLRIMRADPAFNAIGSSVVLSVFDQLLGKDYQKNLRHWGQFIITFPDATQDWTVPSKGWHTDREFTKRSGGPPGLLMFSFISDVPHQHGGTMVLEGSPLLIRNYVQASDPEMLKPMKRARKGLMRSMHWMQQLAGTANVGDRIKHFMETKFVHEGVNLRVAELTGKAGDVIFCHPWLLHVPGPNAGYMPRFMRIMRF